MFGGFGVRWAHLNISIKRKCRRTSRRFCKTTKKHISRTLRDGDDLHASLELLLYYVSRTRFHSTPIHSFFTSIFLRAKFNGKTIPWKNAMPAARQWAKRASIHYSLLWLCCFARTRHLRLIRGNYASQWHSVVIDSRSTSSFAVNQFAIHTKNEGKYIKSVDASVGIGKHWQVAGVCTMCAERARNLFAVRAC